MKRTASANKSSRSKTSSVRWPQFVVCMDNEGYPASLEVGKIYRQIKPRPDDPKDWIRVIDESGEDYIFPAERFAAVEIPPRVQRVIITASPSPSGD